MDPPPPRIAGKSSDCWTFRTISLHLIFRDGEGGDSEETHVMTDSRTGALQSEVRSITRLDYIRLDYIRLD